MKAILFLGMVAGLAFAGTVAAGGAPAQNVPALYENMVAAQNLTHQAWQKLNQAQRKNGDESDAHLQKAQDLLTQASDEVKLAADAAEKARAAAKAAKKKK